MKGNDRQGNKSHVTSVRIDEGTKRRLAAYATATGQTESAAMRDLIVRGLAADGLDLYAGEVAGFVRDVMCGMLAEMDAVLERRNDEHEDRVARVVSRAAKAASVASLASIDIVRGLYPALRERPAEEVWDRYARRAGEMQAGRSFGEALRHASES